MIPGLMPSLQLPIAAPATDEDPDGSEFAAVVASLLVGQATTPRPVEALPSDTPIRAVSGPDNSPAETLDTSVSPVSLPAGQEAAGTENIETEAPRPADASDVPKPDVPLTTAEQVAPEVAVVAPSATPTETRPSERPPVMPEAESGLEPVAQSTRETSPQVTVREPIEKQEPGSEPSHQAAQIPTEHVSPEPMRQAERPALNEEATDAPVAAPSGPAELPGRNTFPTPPTPDSPQVLNPSTSAQAPHTQVVRMLSPLAHAPDGSYRMSLSLTPEELGHVEVHLELVEGRMNVHLVAATPDAREALRQALPELRHELAEQGIHARDLDVSAERREGSHPSLDDSSGRGDHHGARRHSHHRDTDLDPVVAQPRHPAATTRPGASPTLDVRI